MVLAGFLNDVLLRALYRRALALLLSSFAEGFGLALLEAMACGTPMLTSKTPAMPEIAGDAALYVNLYDHDEIAAAMERLFSDQPLRRLTSAGSGRPVWPSNGQPAR